MEPLSREIITAANAKSQKLRELVRAPKILVMPGAHDVLSALLFEQLGFQAIQGSSGGIAAVLGYPDGEVISGPDGCSDRANCRGCFISGKRGWGKRIRKCIPIIGETVRALIAVGCAGMNLEDGAPHQRNEARRLVDSNEQLRKSRRLWRPNVL